MQTVLSRSSKNSANDMIQDAIHTPERLFSRVDHPFLNLATQFIPSIPFLPGEQVLDVGCRNGKVSGVLANLNPLVNFTAITTTPGFLEVIRQDPMLQVFKNIQFEQADPSELRYQNVFDKVVSFLCLTWIQDKQSVVEKVFQALKPGKKAYLQFFVDHGQDWFDACIFEVANKPMWQGYFKNFAKKVKHIKPAEFLYQAEQAGFIFVKADLQKKKTPILNEEYFKYWIMTWSSHLAYLPEDKIDSFFTEVVNTYLNTHPKDQMGTIFYEDYFFETILLKPE